MLPRRTARRRGNRTGCSVQIKRESTQIMQPKKVAIIGAGPSGLVTAKTLIHDYSPGTFAPIIFEKSHEIGGLWPSQPNGPRVGPVNPLMRTNLSRFTVAFSDLAWEPVFEGSDSAADDDGVPMFPQAWQVGKYLEKYTERFLRPHGVLRLGERVLRTIRGMGGGLEGGWTVEWVTESCDDGNKTKDREVKSEQFDFLVVASGYFSSAHISDIPGLHEFESRTIHSSSLHNPEDVQHLLQESDTTTGKVVVIGGSMSGAEAASTLALHPCSSKSPGKNYQVHHICTRPFWTIPTYLPHEIPDPSSGEKRISFLPLDLVMYDLARRPPGPIEYTFGPVSSQQVKKVNGYFGSLLGSDHRKVGKIRGHDERAEESSRPPWMAIGNDYAEYVRSGTISTTIGRVNAVHTNRDSNLATIDINLPSQGDDRTTTLNDVVAIVLATGFTPYNSLSYLPPQILSVLEYSETDPFIPLILDGKGTTHAEIPDIGFVGFYRGPYWGVMEMQARLIAKNWAHDTTFSEPELKKKEKERQSVRDLRNADPHLSRGQFPMGDYIGLMESFARELGMSRLPLAKDLDSEEERSGPVVPARYTFASKSPNTDMDMDKDVTLHSLRRILSPAQTQMDTPHSEAATSMAIFRALHGSWRITRTYHHQRVTTQGTATFHPQYPSSPAYEKEYLYEESGLQHEDDEEQTTPTLTPTNKSIYRLCLHNPGSKRNTHILISSIDTTKDPNTDLRISHGLNLATVTECGGSIAGGYTVCATGTSTTHTIATERGETGADDTLAYFSGSDYGYTYAFHFQGVTILSWECVAVKTGDEDHHSVRTVYERG